MNRPYLSKRARQGLESLLSRSIATTEEDLVAMQWIRGMLDRAAIIASPKAQDAPSPRMGGSSNAPSQGEEITT
jgi:hypothetical protein